MLRLPVFLCALALSTALFAAPAFAQKVPAATLVTSVEGVSEYRLPNGLKVLLLPDASQPTATVHVTYLVGSRHENYGETGMAHLLEHLLFKGTPKHPTIPGELARRGMRLNGMTTTDRTIYSQTFQAVGDNLAWAIGMEADRMVNSFIAQKDLLSEMPVVRNEYEIGENQPASVLYKRMLGAAFDWHNYGHAVIGNRSDIEKVEIANLRAFYRTYYQPDNAVLTITGQFEPAQVLRWINQSFGAIPKPKRVLPKLWTEEPQQDGERSFVVRRQGDVQLVAVVYKSPAIAAPENAALRYANDIMLAVPSGRLYQQFVETGKAVEAFGFGMGGVNPGFFGVGLVVKKGESLAEVRDALVAAVEGFAQTPPTPQEMARARLAAENAIERAASDPVAMADVLSEYIGLGDWRFFYADRDRRARVTALEVTAAAKAYLRRDNRTVGQFIPEDAPQRAPVMPAPPLAEVMRSFKPQASSAPVAAFDSSPASIDAATQIQSIGGIKLALLPKPSRGQAVRVAIRLDWGDEKSLFGKYWVSQLTAGLLGSATSRFNKTELSDELERLKVTGSVFGFATKKANLAEALALAGHTVREPVFLQTELDQLRKQFLVGMESERSDPAAVSAQAIGAHFNRYPVGDYRAHESLDESIAAMNAVTLAQIQAFYADFYGASKGSVAIVGDFDPADARAAVEKAFANWPSAAPYRRLSAQHDVVPPLHSVIATLDKENGMFRAALNLEISQLDADFPALSVGNYIFGGGAGLASRLSERLRQKDGLTYGVDSDLNASTLDRAAKFTVSASAAPQNVAKLAAAFDAELARSVTLGFTEKELRAAQSGLAQEAQQRRTSDAYLANTWTQNLYLNRSFKDSQALEEKIAKLKLPEVNAAWRKYIQPAQLSVVLAFDAAKAGANGANTAGALSNK